MNANPAGTAFVIKAGVHRRQSVVPKSGNQFLGEAGAVLDGEYAVQYAFTKGSAPYPSDVVIRGLVIEHYNPAVQFGAILAGGHQPADGTSGWVIENCEIRYNSTGGGLRIGHRTQVLRNNIHHNAQLGIGGVGDDALIEGNEIAYNNYQVQYDWGWEAGGTKWTRTRNLVVRGNFSHHNHGPGLWTDESNINTTYENNRVEDNFANGIFHEISYAAVIRYNTSRRNGFGHRGWLWGAGILIAASRDVEVYGNVVEGNANGITMVQQNRGSGLYGPHIVQNVYVHDNTIVNGPSGRTGAAQDIGDNSIFTSRNNRFERNTYYLGAGPTPFDWMNAVRTPPQWLAFGHDVAGIFNP